MLRLRAQFRPVEFFLELMKGVVADGFGLAQAEEGSPRGADRAPPQPADAVRGVAARAPSLRRAADSASARRSIWWCR
jgi:hypothetical protein